MSVEQLPEKSAPKQIESIPAVTSPVQLPRLVPSRARYLAGVITGGALFLLALAMLITGLVLL